MRFDDDAIESADRSGDVVVLGIGDGGRIEKASGVVKLDVACRWQRRQRLTNLLRNSTTRHGVIERVRPEVTHDPPEGALPIGQQDHRSWNERARRIALL